MNFEEEVHFFRSCNAFYGSKLFYHVCTETNFSSFQGRKDDSVIFKDIRIFFSPHLNLSSLTVHTLYKILIVYQFMVTK